MNVYIVEENIDGHLVCVRLVTASEEKAKEAVEVGGPSYSYCDHLLEDHGDWWEMEKLLAQLKSLVRDECNA